MRCHEGPGLKRFQRKLLHDYSVPHLSTNGITLHIFVAEQSIPDIHDLTDCAVWNYTVHVKNVVEGSNISRITSRSRRVGGRNQSVERRERSISWQEDGRVPDAWKAGARRRGRRRKVKRRRSRDGILAANLVETLGEVEGLPVPEDLENQGALARFKVFVRRHLLTLSSQV